MVKTFVIGDIHGRHEALKEVLEKSKFNYEEDKLILLGDLVDGGYRTYEVVEELLQIKNIVFILGNHDEWWMNHMNSGWAEEIWIQQGGANTLRSYGAKVITGNRIYNESKLCLKNLRIPVTHQEFFSNAVYWHIEKSNMVFVHGGFNPCVLLADQRKTDLLWDRKLIETARRKPIYKNLRLPIDKNKLWKKVFVGHTTTENEGAEPIKRHNLWMIDCGAGWKGRLCIMDIDTEEYWLSEFQKPAVRGE